jgi:NTE family protein
MPTDNKGLMLDSEAPVEVLAMDREGRFLESGIALCFSGGGYRAMLFHVGSLWRLNELGYLRKLARISSVSGGSITAGVLGMNWSKLGIDDGGVARNFNARVVAPIRGLARRTIDRRAIFTGFLAPGSIADKLAKAYRKHLFGDATLQEFPDDPPRFVINATNVQSGALWRFMKPYMRDWRVGEVRKPDTLLAVAVAASSAFPPVLSPAGLHLEGSDFQVGSGADLQHEPYTTDVILTDGGVYDNLGLETVWKKFRTILVSDAGGEMQPDPDPRKDWAGHTLRILSIIDNQVRSLRKRQIIGSFRKRTRSGAYWGIRSDITGYDVADAMNCPYEKTIRLADVATRLKSLDDTTQERLVNWGYAICDAAMRKHVDSTLPKPDGFPYPAAGIG